MTNEALNDSSFSQIFTQPARFSGESRAYTQNIYKTRPTTTSLIFCEKLLILLEKHYAYNLNSLFFWLFLGTK